MLLGYNLEHPKGVLEQSGTAVVRNVAEFLDGRIKETEIGTVSGISEGLNPRVEGRIEYSGQFDERVVSTGRIPTQWDASMIAWISTLTDDPGPYLIISYDIAAKANDLVVGCVTVYDNPPGSQQAQKEVQMSEGYSSGDLVVKVHQPTDPTMPNSMKVGLFMYDKEHPFRRREIDVNYLSLGVIAHAENHE